MDYEKKYKEALERARQFSEKPYLEDSKGIVDYIFPELKESEDEVICRKLIAFLRQCRAVYGDGFKQFDLNIDDAIAWLEKQGEHARFIEAIQVGDKVTRNEDGVLVNLSQLKRVAKPAEVQGEQKPDDKVEQKSDNWEPQTGDTFRKKGTTSPTYHLCKKQEDGITFGFVENSEVSISGGKITIFALKNDYELVERPKSIEDVVEEELNRALQTKVEQKPWSEEDEYCINQLIIFCENCMVQDTNARRCADWLKSLRPQNRWKPSDEQMHYLSWIANVKLGDSIVEQEVSKHLNELLEDLKKLREE